MDYSFAVITYNSSRYIIETLESIKYQIQRFGTGKEIELVLGDDASSDGTVALMEAWLKENDRLFTAVRKSYHEHNTGTCKNCADVWRLVTSEKMKELAGDDILPANNIFELLDQCADGLVLQGEAILFQEGRIIDDFSRYQELLVQSLYSVKDIKFLSEVCSPMANGVFCKRSMFTPEIISYVEKFRLIEDQPLWYRVFHDIPDVQYRFIERPVVLYRSEGQGVSAQKHGTVSEAAQKDDVTLRSDIAREKNWLSRHIYKERLWANHSPHRVLHIFSPDSLYYKIHGIMSSGELKFLWERERQCFREQEEYLREIQERAASFVKRNVST